VWCLCVTSSGSSGAGWDAGCIAYYAFLSHGDCGAGCFPSCCGRGREEKSCCWLQV
jgi:hypothetical protein